MRVFVIPPKSAPHPHDTEGLLRDLQHLVGGYIETSAPVQLRQNGITLLCNEEGLLKQLPANQNLFPFFYVGQVVAVGVRGEEFVSLTHNQIEFLKDWLYSLS